MKKKLSILLAMIMVLSLMLAGCGEKAADDDNKGKDDTTKNEANDNQDADEEEDDASSNAEIEYDFEVTDYVGSGIEDLNCALYSQTAEKDIPVGQYGAISGGIYAVEEDALIPINLHRVNAGPTHPGLTYIPIKDPANWAGQALLNFVEVEEGFELLVDGVFAGNGITFKISNLKLVYTGGTWVKQ